MRYDQFYKKRDRRIWSKDEKKNLMKLLAFIIGMLLLGMLCGSVLVLVLKSK